MALEFRTRDLIILFKGVTTTLTITPGMAAAGWSGGQGVLWVDSLLDEFLVDITDGERGAGFLLWGSNEDSDVRTSMTGNQVTYTHAVVGSGGWVFSTRTFESLTLASGRTVPIIYTPGDKLLWSLGGNLTNEDEWTVSGDPRAPNENFVGFVVQAPSPVTDGYMTVHTTL